MPENIEKYHSVAVKAAKHVGSLIKSRVWEAKTKVSTKSTAMDFVTDTDREIEGYLKNILKKYFPTHAFIGEEGASTEKKYRLSDGPTWIVDPVDGTMNFVHGYPNVCVSIALYIHKTPHLAIVYNPVIDYFFEAKKGAGAKLNGKPIQVSKTTELSNALVSFEFGSSLNPEKLENSLTNITNLLQKVQGLRSTGSAAMNMAMVALGASDAYYEFGIHIWDVAAGELLVKEAGGVVLDTTGEDFDPLSRRVLCASSLPLGKSLAKALTQLNIARDECFV